MWQELEDEDMYYILSCYSGFDNDITLDPDLDCNFATSRHIHPIKILLPCLYIFASDHLLMVNNSAIYGNIKEKASS